MKVHLHQSVEKTWLLKGMKEDVPEGQGGGKQRFQIRNAMQLGGGVEHAIRYSPIEVRSFLSITPSM